MEEHSKEIILKETTSTKPAARSRTKIATMSLLGQCLLVPPSQTREQLKRDYKDEQEKEEDHHKYTTSSSDYCSPKRKKPRRRVSPSSLEDSIRCNAVGLDGQGEDADNESITSTTSMMLPCETKITSSREGRDNNDDNPRVIASRGEKQLSRRLLYLWHARKRNFEPTTKKQKEAKATWEHLKVCKNKHQCPRPHCTSSTMVLSHFDKCKKMTCGICSPVLIIMQKENALISLLYKNALDSQQENEKQNKKKNPSPNAAASAARITTGGAARIPSLRNCSSHHAGKVRPQDIPVNNYKEVLTKKSHERDRNRGDASEEDEERKPASTPSALDHNAGRSSPQEDAVVPNEQEIIPYKSSIEERWDMVPINSISTMSGKRVRRDQMHDDAGAVKKKRSRGFRQDVPAAYANEETAIAAPPSPIIHPNRSSFIHPHSTPKISNRRSPSNESNIEQLQPLLPSSLSPLLLLANLCLPFIQSLIQSEYGFVFKDPVDAVDLQLYDYHHIIHEPMNLELICENLRLGLYKDISQVQAETRLVFENAITYNGETSEIGKIASKFLNRVNVEFSHLTRQFQRNIQHNDITHSASLLDGSSL